MKRVDESAPRPPAETAVRRRAALATGGGVLAAAWLTGCGPEGGGDNGKAPPARTGTTAPTRSPSPSFSPVAPDWPALAGSLHGNLVRPQDAAYATDRRLYNTRFDALRPAVAATQALTAGGATAGGATAVAATAVAATQAL